MQLQSILWGQRQGRVLCTRIIYYQGFRLKVPRPWPDDQDEEKGSAFIELISGPHRDEITDISLLDERGIEGVPCSRRRSVMMRTKRHSIVIEYRVWRRAPSCLTCLPLPLNDYRFWYIALMRRKQSSPFRHGPRPSGRREPSDRSRKHNQAPHDRKT